MPVSIRKEDKAKRIAANILGIPVDGYVDSFGNKKRFRRKKETENVEGESINRFQEIGFR